MVGWGSVCELMYYLLRVWWVSVGLGDGVGCVKDCQIIGRTLEYERLFPLNGLFAYGCGVLPHD